MTLTRDSPDTILNERKAFAALACFSDIRSRRLVKTARKNAIPW